MKLFAAIIDQSQPRTINLGNQRRIEDTAASWNDHNNKPKTRDRRLIELLSDPSRIRKPKTSTSTMNSTNSETENTAIWVDDQGIEIKDAKPDSTKGALPRLIQEWILDETVGRIELEDHENNLVSDYRTQNELQNDEGSSHLQNRHINESLLLKMLKRPHQVITYREDRWGHLAHGLPQT